MEVDPKIIQTMKDRGLFKVIRSCYSCPLSEDGKCRGKVCTGCFMNKKTKVLIRDQYALCYRKLKAIIYEWRMK